MTKSFRGIAAFATAAVLVAACSSSATPAPTLSNPTAGPGSTGPGAGATTIAVTEVDGSIDASPTTAPAGPVTFQITNNGTQTHEFVVFRTDLAEDQLPLSSDGLEVDEDASGLTIVDEVEDIAIGATENLDVTLDPGHYVLICNIPTHYGLGMHEAFTVQ